MKKEIKPSITFTLLKNAVRLLSLNEGNMDDEAFKKHLDKRFAANSVPYRTPRLLKLNCSINKFVFENMPLYVINENKNNHNTIIFFHGGAYTHQATRFHFEFIDLIAKNTNSTVYMPIYPKAPNFVCDDCYEILLGLYKNINIVGNLVIVGDSAGGGLALGFNKLLHEKKLPYAKKLVLISPWLDITLKNKQIDDYAKRDVLLNRNTLQKVGIVWAGDMNVGNYKLSPINAPLLRDVHVQLFVGSEEMFLPDCRKFRDNMEKTGCSIDYLEYKNLTHDFVLYPFKELTTPKKQIINFIKRKN